jgi:hypothetical protein
MSLYHSYEVYNHRSSLPSTPRVSSSKSPPMYAHIDPSGKSMRLFGDQFILSAHTTLVRWKKGWSLTKKRQIAQHK